MSDTKFDPSHIEATDITDGVCVENNDDEFLINVAVAFDTALSKIW